MIDQEITGRALFFIVDKAGLLFYSRYCKEAVAIEQQNVTYRTLLTNAALANSIGSILNE